MSEVGNEKLKGDEQRKGDNETSKIPIYDTFTNKEVCNMYTYIAGIMCYKFVLEFMNACVNNLILSRIIKTTLPEGLGVPGECLSLIVFHSIMTYNWLDYVIDY